MEGQSIYVCGGLIDRWESTHTVGHIVSAGGAGKPTRVCCVCVCTVIEESFEDSFLLETPGRLFVEAFWGMGERCWHLLLFTALLLQPLFLSLPLTLTTLAFWGVGGIYRHGMLNAIARGEKKRSIAGNSF